MADQVPPESDDLIRERLTSVNEALAGILPYRLEYLDPQEIDLLAKNARFMRNDTYRQLVENVRRDKALESVPLLYAGPDVARPVALSGNHRVMAARDAGLSRILCLVISDPKGAEERIAKQISHNAIVGQDDLQVLKELYDSVADLTLKAYSGIDEEVRKQLNSIKFEPVSEPRLKFKTVTLLFLPREVDELRQVVKEVERLLTEDTTFIAMSSDYAQFFSALAEVKESLSIKNSSVALLEALRRGVEQIRASQVVEDSGAEATGEAAA